LPQGEALTRPLAAVISGGIPRTGRCPPTRFCEITGTVSTRHS
jgi:hypothetical protein